MFFLCLAFFTQYYDFVIPWWWCMYQQFHWMSNSLLNKYYHILFLHWPVNKYLSCFLFSAITGWASIILKSESWRFLSANIMPHIENSIHDPCGGLQSKCRHSTLKYKITFKPCVIRGMWNINELMFGLGSHPQDNSLCLRKNSQIQKKSEFRNACGPSISVKGCSTSASKAVLSVSFMLLRWNMWDGYLGREEGLLSFFLF